MSEPSITYVHIGHIYISKCVYQSDAQSAKVWWRYNKCSSIMYENEMKIPWLAVTSGILIYQSICIYTYILWKFGKDICYQTQMSTLFCLFKILHTNKYIEIDWDAVVHYFW